MYLEGSEYVTYTPVEAYGVSTYADSVISGGNSGDNFVSGGMRFLWIYDPDHPESSGFTGCGHWFCGRDHTPLEDISNDENLRYLFEAGKQNLNDEFQAWQKKIQSEEGGEHYVTEFIVLLSQYEGERCAVSEW